MNPGNRSNTQQIKHFLTDYDLEPLMNYNPIKGSYPPDIL